MSETELDRDRKEEFMNACAFLNLFLSESNYAAGDHLTIADVALVASAANMQVVYLNTFPYFPSSIRYFSRLSKVVYSTSSRELKNGCNAAKKRYRIMKP